MPRPPKNKAVPAAIPDNSNAVGSAPRVIDVDNFIRVRDSVYARLSTIQDLIKSFSADYLRQTNLLLGEPTSLDNFTGAIGELASLPNNLAALAPAGELPPPAEEKKERKKRTHDPNAPKRPLTPYFLYMQTARPIIALDLGADQPKGAVQDEGQRRWGSMNAGEKHGWNEAYQYNLRLYNARVHSYKAGNAEAKNMSDDDALRYAEEHQIPLPAVSGLEERVSNEQDAIAEQLQTAAAEAAEEAAAKTPKAKVTRKRKSAAAEEAEISKAVTPASPERKRKRTSTKPVEEKEEPKKTGRGKKAKSG